MMKHYLAAPLLLLLPFLALAQNKIAERPIGQVVVTFSATPTFDAGQSHSFKITLTGNVTSSTVVGMEAGQELTFEVCQDGVGARTFAWPGLMVGPIAILAGANVCTVETFHYDGTSAIIWTTTTAGGGGSGTVSSGTGKCFTWYAATGTTVSNDCNLDDGLTNALALTYSPANGIFATQYNSTTSGAFTMVGTEGTVGGAASGKDVIACGDLTSHTCQISNNGDSFRSIATHNSTSPVVGGVMVSATFPQMIASSRGTAGQPFLEGSGNPGFGPLDLSQAINVTSRLVKANQTASTAYNDQVNTFTSAGTLDLTASTVASAFRVPVTAGLTTALNGGIGYDSTNNLFHAGVNGADARFAVTTITPTDTFCAQWTRTSGHYELGQASGTCGTPGGAGSLGGLTAATGANSINNGDNAQTWNANLTTAGKHWFTITENSASTATGIPYLFDIHSIASSTANPLTVTAAGTANGVAVLKSSFLTSQGTGGIDSNMLFCDAGTSTKCIQNVFSNITAANTRAITYPDVAGTNGLLTGSFIEADCINAHLVGGLPTLTTSTFPCVSLANANSWTNTQTFNTPIATNPPLVITPHSGTPSNLVNGAFWVDTNQSPHGINARINGASVQMYYVGGTPVVASDMTACQLGIIGGCAITNSAMTGISASVSSGIVTLGNTGTLTAGNAAAANQVCESSGANSTCSFVDHRDVKIIPFANCVAGVAGGGVNTATSNFTAACRAGTNNLGGVDQAIPSTGASLQFMIELPKDWDTGAQPFVNVYYASGANTTGTVIWTASSACTDVSTPGGTSDDPTFTAESAFATQTMAVANRMWFIGGQFANVTSGNGCKAQSPVTIKLALSGTASSNINAYQAVVTIPTRPVSQAN